MIMKKLIIFGNGQIAQLAKYYFDKDSDYEVIAFLANKEYITSNTFEDLPLIALENLEEYFPNREVIHVFIAMSYSKMNKNREKIYREIKKLGYRLTSYVSSKCNYLSQFSHGENCFILEDNTIQPFVQIGNNVTLWSGNHIGHHTIISDHNFISSHVVVSGNCRIKSNCFIGVNSTIHNDVTIEKENLIGAGAIIAKSTVEKGVYLPPKSSLFRKASNELNL